MKKILSILVLAIALISCGDKKESPKEERTVESRDTKRNPTHYDEVYVCGGRYAKRYHNDEYCKGLQSCKGGIEIMTIEEAEDLGKTPCGYCYGY